MPKQRYERRLDAANLKVRDVATQDGETTQGVTLEGYAAKFDEPTVLFADSSSKVVEVIRPGSFANALAEDQDVRALVDHNASLILGRTKAGTLSLVEDEVGLYFRLTLPDTTIARDLAENIRLGNVNNCSFAFTPRSNGEASRTEQEGEIRVTYIELTDVDLFDVSIVTYPAYAGTTVSIEARCRAIADRPGRVSRRNTRKAAAIRLADFLLKRKGKK